MRDEQQTGDPEPPDSGTDAGFPSAGRDAGDPEPPDEPPPGPTGDPEPPDKP